MPSAVRRAGGTRQVDLVAYLRHAGLRWAYLFYKHQMAAANRRYAIKLIPHSRYYTAVLVYDTDTTPTKKGAVWPFFC